MATYQSPRNIQSILCSGRASMVCLLFLYILIDRVPSSAQGCTLSFLSSSSDLVLTDCDGSGSESANWKAPEAKAGEGCGPINLSQTAGPTPGVEIPAGSSYDVVYTAMAVDKKTLQIVRKTQTFQVKVEKDKLPPVLKNLPARNLKKGDKIPDISKSVDASDNCTARNKLRFNQSPAAGSAFDGTTKSIKLTATDASGNQAVLTIDINTNSTN